MYNRYKRCSLNKSKKIRENPEFLVQREPEPGRFPGYVELMPCIGFFVFMFIMGVGNSGAMLIKYSRGFGLSILITVICLVTVRLVYAHFLYTKPSPLQVDTPVLQLGKVQEGQTLTCSVWVRNASTRRMAKIDVRPSCGCTTATDLPALNPGERAKITAIWDTTGRTGITDSTVWIAPEGVASEPIAVTLVADAIHVFTLEPRQIDYGVMPVGATRSSVIDLRRIDHKPFLIRDVQKRAGFTTKTLIVAPDHAQIMVSLPPQQHCGIYADTIKVDTDDPVVSELTLPIKFTVAPLYKAEPSNVDLGFRQPGERGMAKVRLLMPKDVSVRVVSSPLWAITEIITKPDGVRSLLIHYKLEERGGKIHNESIVLSTNDSRQPQIAIPVLCIVDKAGGH